MDATFSFNCAKAAVAKYIDMGLFAAFKGTRQIDSQIASAQGQFKRQLKRPAGAQAAQPVRLNLGQVRSYDFLRRPNRIAAPCGARRRSAALRWPAAPTPYIDIEAFRITAGEAVFLHGPSGCGKSIPAGAAGGRAGGAC